MLHKFPMTAAFLTSAAVLATAQPALADPQQDDAPAEVSERKREPRPTLKGSAFDGDFLAVGLGVGIGPDYVGSDDYTILPIPVLQGSFGGIDINPRRAGFALDLINDGDNRVSFQFGPVAKLNLNRSITPDDPLVSAFPDLDMAVEVGPTAGVAFTEVLHSVDSLSMNVDLLFDVAGAHDGMLVRPTATYFTPLSRAAAVSFSLHATWVDDDFADYYYTVDPALAPGTPLPAFEAEGGFRDTGVTLLGFVDANGNLLDGGLAVFGVVNYTRVLGDAADSPFTSIAGSRDQFFAGVGIGYGF